MAIIDFLKNGNTYIYPITLTTAIYKLDGTLLDTWMNSHTHSYLPLSGGTMTGNISFKMYNYTSTPLKVYGGDVNGQSITLCAGASTIVGSGESGFELEKTISAVGEDLHLASDYNINFYTNGQTWSNARQCILDSARQFYPATNGAGSIGTKSNKWGNAYLKGGTIDGILRIENLTNPDLTKQNPSIVFAYGDTEVQNVWIKYNEYDNYRFPAGLIIGGVQGGEYLVVDGDIKTNKGALYTPSQIVFELGNAIAGNIKVTGTVPNSATGSGTTTGTRYPIKFWGHEQYGIGVKIGDGGCTVVGAGESPDTIISAMSIAGGTETLFLTSDGGIRFFTKCDTIANRIESSISTDGRYTGRTINATSGYQFNGAAGKITGVQSGAPNTNMLWAW